MKDKKKAKYFIFCIILTLVLNLMITPAIASVIQKQITVSTGLNLYIDDVKFTPKDLNENPIDAFISNGTTYLPVRAIAEAVGKSVFWDEKTGSVYLVEYDSDKSDYSMVNAKENTSLNKRSIGENVGNAISTIIQKQITVFTGVNIYVDDAKLTPKDSNGNPIDAFISNGTTYLPVRAVAEAVGKPVFWDGKTRTVYLGEHESDELDYNDLSIEGMNVNKSFIKGVGGGGYFINKDGSLWSWGENYDGQLGNGTTENSLVPVKVLDNVKEIKKDSTSIFAIKHDGSLWSWGRNFSGNLGNGTIENSLVPVKILDDVKSIDVGDVSYAIKTDGSLWGWGSNSKGRLGIGDSKIEYVLSPIKVLDDIKGIKNHSGTIYAIKSDGSLWSWGSNSYLGKFSNHDIWVYGLLGNGTIEDSFVPVKILDDVEIVEASSYTSCAIKTDGSLWCWGVFNGNNEMSDNILTPIKVLDNVDKIKLYNDSVYAIKKDKSLWSFGPGDVYRWITGPIFKERIEIEDGLIPVKISDEVDSVEAAGLVGYIIKTDGSLWSWGFNLNGELGIGNGEIEKSLVPVKVLDNVKTVETGLLSTPYALKTDGSLWTWGGRKFYILYNGIPEPSLSPVKILDDVENITTVMGATYVIKTDDSLWSWGYNVEGQLGNGTTENSFVPVKIIDSPNCKGE